MRLAGEHRRSKAQILLARPDVTRLRADPKRTRSGLQVRLASSASCTHDDPGGDEEWPKTLTRSAGTRSTARGIRKRCTRAGSTGPPSRAPSGLTAYERTCPYFLDSCAACRRGIQGRLGNHIADPPLPVGYRASRGGTDPMLSPAFDVISALSKSPSHGSICARINREGLKDPSKEILGVIDTWRPATRS